MAVDNDIRGDLRPEQSLDVKVTVEQIRKDLLEVDSLVRGVLSEWLMDEADIQVIRKAIALARMKLAGDCQKLDKLTMKVITEERINTIGFRPNNLGGQNREVTKGSSGDDIISQILRGEHVSAKDVREVI